MTKGELALLLAPSLSLIAGYGSFRFATNAYETDTSRYLWNSHSEWHWFLALYMLLAFAAMLTIIISYQRIKDSRRKEKEEAVLAGQAEDMKKHIREVEKLYRDICGIRHDMGNHIATLEHLYNRKEYENAEKYIAQWKAGLQETSPEIKTGNPVTDVILTERKKEAEEKGIEFVCDFHYPEGTKVNAFDLSVVLNNALNNAISGAEESDKPYVQISSYRKQNAYMIEVRNPYMGEIVLHEETGLPETTKKDKEGHGFGMANIQKVAQKYYGDIAIELKENCFLLHIMLMVG